MLALFCFFLGVDRKTAARAACRAEHTVGPEVIDRLTGFMEFATIQNKKGHDIVGLFENFLQTGSKTKRRKTKPKRKTRKR